jgi:hypothetical protein
MTIRHTVDDARRLLEIELSGVVTGREFVTFSSNLYGSRVELFDYDCILNLLEYEGEVGYADLNPLQQIYADQPQSPASPRPGIIVTLDANFHLWAAALDAQFPGRKHYVVSSLEEAFARLESLHRSEAESS